MKKMNRNKRRDRYETPLAERYASAEMLYLFSPENRYRTWRRLWIALAEAERALGLPITPNQIRELKRHADDVDFDAARRHEERLKHDVMAHIHAYAEQCPKAAPIIHLGATSMYVVDNADLILAREAMRLLLRKAVNVVDALARFARRTASLPTVAYTHFQPAQFTTVGKRACLWIDELLMDIEELERRIEGLQFLGGKGATGTQASFLALLGSERKVRDLDKRIARAMGFSAVRKVTGQTYSRKVDAQILATLAGFAQSAHKFANDLRLLQHLGEIQEPFTAGQVGSSAMAYKRNPMKAERMTSIARLVIVLSQNAAFTAANQWFERTLDDSAGKRIAVPEAFLAVDAILHLYHAVADGMVVDRDLIRANVDRELPFIATENLLMEAVKRGGDRQALHEVIRRHALASKREGKNDLWERLKKEDAFRGIPLDEGPWRDPRSYVGRAPGQAEEFLREDVAPLLRRYRKSLGWKAVVKV